MKHKIITSIIALSLLATIPAWGQTNVIKRQNNDNQNSSASKPKTTTGKKNAIKPVEQEKGIYYICVNTGYNLGWMQQVCREMRAKGYPAIVIKTESMYENKPLYYTCVSTFKDRESANAFCKSFSDERYHIYSVQYNGHYIEEDGLGMNSDQLYELAEDYYYGRNGKEKSNYDAEKWYEQAAYLDNALAQLKLGIWYEEKSEDCKSYYPEGVLFYKKKAIEWYEKAASNGNANAKSALERLKGKE